jgi:hypothetical protein
MKMKPLSLPHARMPELELREPGYKPMLSARGEDFQIALSGHGFDVTRQLSVADLMEIRNWCEQAIVRSEALQAAE